MIVSYDCDELRRACLDIDEAQRCLGMGDAQALVTLVADIEAMGDCGEFLAFAAPEARVSGNDSLTVSIGSEYEAVFVPAGERFVRAQGGAIDWSSVRRLKLVQIGRRV